jgi:dTDP-4-dehydrorhamnose reductase
VGFWHKTNMSNTLLIIGASGLTGSKLMRLAQEKFEAYGTYNARTSSNEPWIKLDIKDEDIMRKLFKELKPDIVINTAALHNVDYCESHPQEAYDINTKAVGIIADFCNNLGSRLIHFSSDFVFDGKKVGRYLESDIPNPLSIYGKSKLAGESQAKKCASFSIIRSSVIFGWMPLEVQGSVSSSGKPMNFAVWLLQMLKRREEIRVVNDQFTTPTLADMLAEVALNIATTEKNEVYHVTGTSCLCRYEFARKISEVMGYSSDRISIKPVSSVVFSQVAKRPMNSCLNSERLGNELNYELLDVDRSLAIMRSQLESEYPSLLGS